MTDGKPTTPSRRKTTVDLPIHTHGGDVMHYEAMILFGLVLAGASPMYGQAADPAGDARCRPAAHIDAATALRGTFQALGAGNLRVPLHQRMTDAVTQDYQSDRTYPPFFLAFIDRESWLEPTTGVARIRGRVVFPGSESDFPDILSSAQSTFLMRDTAFAPAAGRHGEGLLLRALDPWTVIADWIAGGGATVEGECPVRDFYRTILARSGPYGKERLALDRRTGLPVSLERVEPHYLWGQVAVEYVYSNWTEERGIFVPTSSFRMVDGTPEVSRTVSVFAPAASDSAPSLALPDTAVRMVPSVPDFLRPTPPDSVRVAANVSLLVNRGYTEGVVLLGDTLYLLDATQGEERARADSTLIDHLFPGRHPVVLIVTDLAWPHIAGLRYWVARGATVVSHRASRAFLEQVLRRRWTRAPDLYERRRKGTAFSFRAVDDSLSLAGGKLRLYGIDGPSSEGALMAWVEDDRFLWASDYIQTVQQPTTYLNEVWGAVQRTGITPRRVAAEHLPITAWSTIDSLARVAHPNSR
jgi:hypothetical protein